MENSRATHSLKQISSRLASSPTEVIREFLVECGEIYQRPITSAQVRIWERELEHLSVPRLRAAMSKVLRDCRYFPTIADVAKADENLRLLEATNNFSLNPGVRQIDYERPETSGCEACKYTGFVLGSDKKARVCPCRRYPERACTEGNSRKETKRGKA